MRLALTKRLVVIGSVAVTAERTVSVDDRVIDEA